MCLIKGNVYVFLHIESVFQKVCFFSLRVLGLPFCIVACCGREFVQMRCGSSVFSDSCSAFHVQCRVVGFILDCVVCVRVYASRRCGGIILEVHVVHVTSVTKTVVNWTKCTVLYCNKYLMKIV